MRLAHDAVHAPRLRGASNDFCKANPEERKPFSPVPGGKRQQRIELPDGQGEAGEDELKTWRKPVTKETQSYIDMLRNFGTNFGLPQVDVEKLLETNRKNLEALGESAKVAAGGAQSMAQKQREILEAGLREASALARGYQPMGNAQEILAKQTEFVKKVFDISVQGARDSAELATQSTSEAVKIIQERVKASLEEIRGSVNRQSGQARSETPKG